MADALTDIAEAGEAVAAADAARRRLATLQAAIQAEQRAVAAAEQALVREEDDVRAMRRWGPTRLVATVTRQRRDRLAAEQREVDEAAAALAIRRETLDRLVEEGRATRAVANTLEAAEARLRAALERRSRDIATTGDEATDELGQLEQRRGGLIVARREAAKLLELGEIASDSLRRAEEELAEASFFESVYATSRGLRRWAHRSPLERFSDRFTDQVEDDAIARTAGTNLAMARYAIHNLVTSIDDGGELPIDDAERAALTADLRRFLEKTAARVSAGGTKRDVTRAVGPVDEIHRVVQARLDGLTRDLAEVETVRVRLLTDDTA